MMTETGEHNKSDQQTILKPLSYYQHKIMESKEESGMWIKDMRVNFPCGGEEVFDDFFKTPELLRPKVKSFTVWKKMNSDYICGLQFTYQSTLSPEKVVPGFLMGPKYSLVSNQSKTFELEDDEYVIAVTGRKGMIIDNFGVLTSKGAKYNFGGTGGGPFEVHAPLGYHFTCFGALYTEGWGSISTFSADVHQIYHEEVQLNQLLGLQKVVQLDKQQIQDTVGKKDEHQEKVGDKKIEQEKVKQESKSKRNRRRRRHQNDKIEKDVKCSDDTTLQDSSKKTIVSHSEETSEVIKSEQKEMVKWSSSQTRCQEQFSVGASKPMLRKLIDFLTISEVTKLFRLSREFSMLRYDEYVLNVVGCRCIYSGQPRLIKYIKKILKNFSDRTCRKDQFTRIQNYLRLSENHIKNPHGDQQFEGFEKVQEGGNGIVVQDDGKQKFFQFSFGWGSLLWKCHLEEIFGTDSFVQEKVIEKIQSAQYAIVVGASIAESGFGSESKLKLDVLDQEGKTISSITKAQQALTREFQFYSLKYIHTLPEITPHSLQFQVLGKDTCYWAGFYGAKVRNITFKIMPISNEHEKTLFEKYIE